jgi:hypothetical protein|eukprot:scaffold1657_cov182-Alexandrium_tamarense.AAC.21
MNDNNEDLPHAHEPSADDFEESIVRAVIEENPPEEQGLREEWNEHIGWHQKENVRLRGRQPKPDAVPLHQSSEEGEVITKVKKSNSPGGNKQPLPSEQDVGGERWLILICIIGCCFIFVIYQRKWRTKKVRMK